MTREIQLVTQVGAPETVRIGPALGSGAAGAVHPVIGDVTRVVKIYNDATLNSDGARYKSKIEAMIRQPPQLLAPPKPPGSPVKGAIVQLAWPSAVAMERGRFLGFAMPAMEVTHTAELEFVMQDKQAKKAGLRSDLASRLLLAHNLAAVVHGIHERGHAVVDMKPVNMKFYKQELYMAVLDCDGFSIAGFPAPQVTPDYRAPEFFGKSVANPEAQDRFALAVIIFRLLNFGDHPFSGVGSSATIPTDLELRIRDGLYPYGRHMHPQIAPRPGSTHECLPDDLRALCDRAFGKVSSLRPSAIEWANALAPHAPGGRQSLEDCGKGHFRFRGMPCGNCLKEDLKRGRSVPASKTQKTVPQIPAAPPRQTRAGSAQAIITSAPSLATRTHRGFGWWWKIMIFLFVALGTALWLGKPNWKQQIASSTNSLQRTLAPIIAPAPLPYWGVHVETVKHRGVRIIGLDGASVAAKAGLKRNDLVVSVDNQKILNRMEFETALQKSSEQGIHLGYQRGKTQKTILLKPEMLAKEHWEQRTSALRQLAKPDETKEAKSQSKIPGTPVAKPAVRQTETRQLSSISTASAKDGNAAAIRNILHEGEQCLAAARNDCAQASARSVLQLEPDNSEAQSLLQRVRQAQARAMDSITIR